MAKPTDPGASAQKARRTLSVRRAKPTPDAKPAVPERVIVPQATRYEMIATAAYYLAERRGFAPGGELADWLAAESAVEAQFAAQDTARH